jgi:hypothetical protein
VNQFPLAAPAAVLPPEGLREADEIGSLRLIQTGERPNGDDEVGLRGVVDELESEGRVDGACSQRLRNHLLGIEDHILLGRFSP